MSKDIETGLPECARCHKDITDLFNEKPWCADCSFQLVNMSFDGELVLELIMEIMPPQPPSESYSPVNAWTVLRLARAIMIREKILLPGEDEGDDGAPVPKKPSLILT